MFRNSECKSQYVIHLQLLMSTSTRLGGIHFGKADLCPQNHLFFMNFHPHPPLQTFTETTCGHE